MKLALKIDVDTWRGTLQGVPRLVELLRQNDAQATFLFSLGPDHTGRALKRVFRPGFLKKVSRTSVVSHYGIKTLLYGTVLPGPDIGRGCAEILRGVRDSGYEVGIHCWDHIKWQDGVEHADAIWTHQQLSLACERFEEIFGSPSKTHGAAGWQMNSHALRFMQQMGFNYSSDCRGTHPFMPVHNGELVLCPQLPTTLPTLDELIGMNGITNENVHEHLLALTDPKLQHSNTTHFKDHVFTLHAELEGMKLLPILERLLAGWRTQGYSLTSTQTIFQDLEPASLPRHEIIRGTLPGRSGTLMLQGEEFLTSWKLAA